MAANLPSQSPKRRTEELGLRRDKGAWWNRWRDARLAHRRRVLEQLAYKHLSRAVDDAGPELPHDWVAYADPDLNSLRRPGSPDWARIVQPPLETIGVGRSRPPERPWGAATPRAVAWSFVAICAGLGVLLHAISKWDVGKFVVVAMVIAGGVAGWRAWHARQEDRRGDSDALGDAGPQRHSAASALERERARAIAALQHGAKAPKLTLAADALGAALLAIERDDAVWAPLREAAKRPWADDPERRHRCREALDLEWDQLMRRIGPAPPPPLDLQTTELIKSMDATIDNEKAEGLDSTRRRLRDVATALGTPGTAAARSLRQGVRVSARVPALAELARRPAWATVQLPATLGLTAPQLLGEPAFDDLVDLLREGARRALATILNRIEEESRETADGVDPADRAAHEAVRSIDNALIGRLLDSWRTIAQLDAVAETTAQEQTPETIASPPSDPLRRRRDGAVKGTGELHATVASALHRLWDASTGAPWATAEFDRFTEELQDPLRVIRAELDRPDDADAARMVTMLERLSRSLISTQELVGLAVPHRPDEAQNGD